VAQILVDAGADTALEPADQFAIAVSRGRLEAARQLLTAHPQVARTDNPEEDRLLADMAGRNASEPVAFLLSVGADITATGLDFGTPLHQACWFGQPQNAQLLVDVGAPLEAFDATHQSSPLGWVTHGARYSGGCDERLDRYVELAEILLRAGARMEYPDDSSDAYRQRLFEDAPPSVAVVLRRYQKQ
jgi:ankyrin repeat protein